MDNTYSQKEKTINSEDKRGQPLLKLFLVGALKEEKGLRADTNVVLLLLDRLVFVKYLE